MAQSLEDKVYNTRRRDGAKPVKITIEYDNGVVSTVHGNDANDWLDRMYHGQSVWRTRCWYTPPPPIYWKYHVKGEKKPRQSIIT